MNGINIEKHVSPMKLEILGVYNWPTWEKENSEFPWSYDQEETCYILRGKATVTPEGGEPIEIGRGDFVTFPAGMSCTWKITKPIEKHYSFS